MAFAVTGRAEPMREPFVIVIATCQLGIYWTTVQPAAPEHSGMGFATQTEAQAYAEALSRITSWPIKDRSE